VVDSAPPARGGVQLAEGKSKRIRVQETDMTHATNGARDQESNSPLSLGSLLDENRLSLKAPRRTGTRAAEKDMVAQQGIPSLVGLQRSFPGRAVTTKTATVAWDGSTKGAPGTGRCRSRKPEQEGASDERRWSFGQRGLFMSPRLLELRICCNPKLPWTHPADGPIALAANGKTTPTQSTGPRYLVQALLFALGWA
jgi:hypothetical protein